MVEHVGRSSDQADSVAVEAKYMGVRPCGAGTVGAAVGAAAGTGHVCRVHW